MIQTSLIMLIYIFRGRMWGASESNTLPNKEGFYRPVTAPAMLIDTPRYWMHG